MGCAGPRDGARLSVPVSGNPGAAPTHEPGNPQRRLRSFAYAQHGIQATRSRPYKKDDYSHVEQKNGTDVRGPVGYRRYDTEEQCALLNRLYEIDDLHLNFWVPCRKLIGRVRDEHRGTWRKRYDTPRTPLECLLERPDEEVPAAVKEPLRVLPHSLIPWRCKKKRSA